MKEIPGCGGSLKGGSRGFEGGLAMFCFLILVLVTPCVHSVKIHQAENVYLCVFLYAGYISPVSTLSKIEVGGASFCLK